MGLVLSRKYLRHSTIMSYESKPSDSASWKGIIRSMHRVKAGFGWRVGQGSLVSFWFDSWLDQAPLCLFITLIPPSELQLTVQDMLLMDGKIEVGKIQTVLPPTLRHKLLRF